MNTYEINLTFATEKDLQTYLDGVMEKHPDGIRELYNHETVWAINTEQAVDVYTMKRGPITLRNIQTWRA